MTNADIRTQLEDERRAVERDLEKVKRRNSDGYHDLLEHVMACLLERNAQVAAVLELADGWEARGESDIAFSKTIDDESISTAILGNGAEMVERARLIRRAIEEAGK